MCILFQSSRHRESGKGEKIIIESHLKQSLTKAGLLFLFNVLVVFDKFNIYFQTMQTFTIHKLYGESERLLKTLLSFFIVSNVLR